MKIEDKKEEFLRLIWENSCVKEFERHDAELVFDALSNGPLKDIQTHIDTNNFTLSEQAAKIEILKSALERAKETIRALHGETALDIYDNHSPEMKQINEALKG